ncbi:MAG: hypothetical protein ACK4M7_05080 [Burkholderiales bacterium]
MATYARDLLSSAYQMARLQQLQHIYFGTSVEDSSPCSKAYLDFIFNPSRQQGKSIPIFSLLGIYLPRNAANQVLAGRLIDLKDKSAA